MVSHEGNLETVYLVSHLDSDLSFRHTAFLLLFLTRILYIQIPLPNRVRGPYHKLRTEFSRIRFMAQARSARAINRRGKTRIRNLQYGPRRPAWLVRYLLYLYCVSDEFGNDFYP